MASNRASLRTADGSRTPWQPCPPSWRVKWPLRLGGIDGRSFAPKIGLHLLRHIIYIHLLCTWQKSGELKTLSKTFTMRFHVRMGSVNEWPPVPCRSGFWVPSGGHVDVTERHPDQSGRPGAGAAPCTHPCSGGGSHECVPLRQELWHGAQDQSVGPSGNVDWSMCRTEPRSPFDAHPYYPIFRWAQGWFQLRGRTQAQGAWQSIRTIKKLTKFTSFDPSSEGVWRAFGTVDVPSNKGPEETTECVSSNVFGDRVSKVFGWTFTAQWWSVVLLLGVRQETTFRPLCQTVNYKVGRTHQ